VARQQEVAAPVLIRTLVARGALAISAQRVRLVDASAKPRVTQLIAAVISIRKLS
jgi:hypothetical protein